jgi:hypothetical protein
MILVQPRLKLELEEPQRIYFAGELLAGQFTLQGVPESQVRAIELSVLWHTEGKGDEDMSVHHFQRIEPGHGEATEFRQPRRFSTVLPNSPLSYDGLIVKICWCVRARVFLERGKELTVETSFQLGSVPAPSPGTAIEQLQP